MNKNIVKEIETRTVRTIPIEEVEQALCDQYDLGIPGQDDLKFFWMVSPMSGLVTSVEVTTIERTTETI